MLIAHSNDPVAIISSTVIEIEPFIKKASSVEQVSDGLYRITLGSNPFDLLITGVGIPAATYEISSFFASRGVPFAIQIGIAGSYKEDIKNGSVVAVVEEEFGELGIDKTSHIATLFEAGFVEPDHPPFHSGKLINIFPSEFSLNEKLRKVKGVTVNVVTSRKTTIQNRKDNYNADIETMESAAFFYCCLKNEIPFLSLRGISNKVGEIDRSKWLISESIQNVCDTMFLILQKNNFFKR